MTRRLAGSVSRRSLLAGLIGAAAGFGAKRTGVAACPPDSVSRRGGCLCRISGRPPTDGQCPCPAGQERCGPDCVAPRRYLRDPRHCGRCGNACASPTPFCDRGVCIACLIDADCDEGNLCTTNRCDPETGCQTTNLIAGLPCSDGVFCNGLEVCDGSGRCVPGLDVDCGPCLTCVEASPHCVTDSTQNGAPCGSGDHVCADGSCVCPAGKRACDGACRECCTDLHCPENRPDCQDGVCRCRGAGLACDSSAQCCPGNLCGSGFCCTRAGQPCVTAEQCCGGGCDFDSDLGHRVCG